MKICDRFLSVFLGTKLEFSKTIFSISLPISCNKMGFALAMSFKLSRIGNILSISISTGISALSITIGIIVFFSFNASLNSSLTYAEEELFPDNMQRKILELMISALIVCSKSDDGWKLCLSSKYVYPAECKMLFIFETTSKSLLLALMYISLFIFMFLNSNLSAYDYNP